jgi:peroxiredoxin
MKAWKRISLLALAITLAAIIAGCTLNNRKTDATSETAPSGSSEIIGTAIGNTAPDFQLAKMDGASVSLNDLKGQPSVIVFWTAWCPVCREEAPHINQLASQYEPRGVRVIGINIQDSQARTESGIKDFGIQYAVARDPDASVTRRYNVKGTPTVIFLDKFGVVRYYGNELPRDYPEQLDALIAEKG